MSFKVEISDYLLHDILPLVERPARYIGGERGSIKKDFAKANARIVLAFPDVYEIASGNLGHEILYHILNEHPDFLAERVYAPWSDMEKSLLDNSIPLFTLENKIPAREFDMIGFTVPYELAYTGVLTILNASGIGFESKGRGFPIIGMGGSCAFNPSVMSKYIDFFNLGDGEENIVRIGQIIADARNEIDKHRDDENLKLSLLEKIADLPGVYVPAIKIKSKSKAIVENLEDAPFPRKAIVPYFGEMKNRITLEVFRGCTHGCRFCQAGYIYRPYRKRPKNLCIAIAKESFEHTGHNEISLSSLNTTDYPELIELIEEIASLRIGRPVTISIPSSRIASFSHEMSQSLKRYTTGSVTLAIEAGTERLRKVINKHTSDEEIINTVQSALLNGFGEFKFYFMTGLPTENKEDVEAIVELVHRIRKIYGDLKSRNEIPHNLNFQIKVAASNFVPKPVTPFQWCAMDDIPSMIEKHGILKPIRSIKNAKLRTHSAEMSFLEGVISRGDARIGNAIETAWRMGSRFESWSERLDINLWLDAFEKDGINPNHYIRERSLDEEFSWDFAPTGIDKKFLRREYEKALRGEETEDCFEGDCIGCGLWKETCSRIERRK